MVTGQEHTVRDCLYNNNLIGCSQTNRFSGGEIVEPRRTGTMGAGHQNKSAKMNTSPISRQVYRPSRSYSPSRSTSGSPSALDYIGMFMLPCGLFFLEYAVNPILPFTPNIVFLTFSINLSKDVFRKLNESDETIRSVSRRSQCFFPKPLEGLHYVVRWILEVGKTTVSVANQLVLRSRRPRKASFGAEHSSVLVTKERVPQPLLPGTSGGSFGSASLFPVLWHLVLSTPSAALLGSPRGSSEVGRRDGHSRRVAFSML